MKNLLTHFSKIRGYFSASQGNDVGYDCRLTVVRPSFDCRSTVLKLCSILVIVLTVGVGNVWGATLTYTHDFTVKPTENADNTLSTITWTVSNTTNLYGYNSKNYKGVQFGTGSNTGSITLTSKNAWGAQTSTSYYGYTNVKKVYVWLNKGGGDVTPTVSVGGTAATSDGTTVTKNSSATSQRDGTTMVTFTPASDHTTGVIVITCNSTAAGYLCSIQVECETPPAPADPYTVTFNPQGGYFADESVFSNTDPYQIDEASAGAGVTLPEASTDCSGDGWAFYGWATSAKTSSPTTAPTIVGKAGDTYNPTSDITLHAVFAKGEYTKETSSITAGGKYLIVANSGGHNYVMTNDYSTSGDDGQLAGALIDETSTNKYHAAAVNASYVFTIVTSASVSVGSGDWMIKNIADNKYVSADYTSFYISNIGSADGNTITLSTGTWTIKNVYSSSKYKVYYNSSNNVFCSTSSTASSLLIYKETKTTNYSSTPTCCDKPTALTKGSFSRTIFHRIYAFL
ncbi:hypothetical protein IJ556_07655 [bacterium]|nr:hypothetical protein [bacterium]